MFNLIGRSYFLAPKLGQPIAYTRIKRLYRSVQEFIAEPQHSGILLCTRSADNQSNTKIIPTIVFCKLILLRIVFMFVIGQPCGEFAYPNIPIIMTNTLVHVLTPGNSELKCGKTGVYKIPKTGSSMYNRRFYYQS